MKEAVKRGNRLGKTIIEIQLIERIIELEAKGYVCSTCGKQNEMSKPCSCGDWEVKG